VWATSVPMTSEGAWPYAVGGLVHNLPHALLEVLTPRRFAREEEGFDGQQSPAFEHRNQFVGAAPPEAVQGAVTRAPAAPARPGRAAESSASSRR
jgi:hypothetical protein